MKKNKKCLIYKNAVEALKVYLGQYLCCEVPIDRQEPLSPLLKIETLEKAKIIIRDGTLYANSFWLYKGYGRYFMTEINSEGITSEVTIGFCGPGKMMLVKEFFLNNAFDKIGLQLAPGAVIVSSDGDFLDALKLNKGQAERLTIKLAALYDPEQLIKTRILTVRPRYRYMKFLNVFGAEIEQYFTVKQIASYLGMQPSYLSRIRGELIRKKMNTITYLQTVFLIAGFV